MSDNTPSQPSDPTSDMLWGFWYPALRSDQLRGGKLERAMLLEVPLVLGRDAAGKPFALRDVCPHRAFPLSFGRFDGASVECAYHGWQFDAHTGQCRHIPSLTSDSKLKCDRIYAGSFPCEERDGYVWVFMANPEGRNFTSAGTSAGIAPNAAPSAPPAPELPTFSAGYQISHLWADLPCSVDHGIIGLMDPAHGPFVHQAWWWRSRRSIRDKAKQFEPIPNGFRMSPHAPSSNSAPYKLLKLITGEPATTTIDFVLPNQRFEQIRAGKYWLSSRTTVTPMRRDLCRLDFVAAWNILPWFPVVSFIIHVLGPRFIRQDTEVIEKQALGLKYEDRMMLVDDADRQARWYFELKAAHLESQRTGAPMRHPVSGPITLRWRS
ncbi:MAG TPA: Rieske 2Fe-2S domain-containing protein [Candidatus Acidoferrales bacterium]|nr:Rieske 2Fe-2S domain-containing protein [Candidatus Acidoferrales bacterium]HXR10241.1 Rieske 2Fe-2S domain-containing protein [Candidatus Acidoferrales bacterium]